MDDMNFLKHWSYYSFKNNHNCNANHPPIYQYPSLMYLSPSISLICSSLFISPFVRWLIKYLSGSIK